MSDKEELCVINFQAHQITKNRVIDTTRLALDVSKLPKALRLYLNRAVLPSEELTPFDRVKQDVIRELSKMAQYGPHGWVIERCNIKEAVSKIKEAEEKYADLKRQLKPRYADICKKAVDDFRKTFKDCEHINTLCDAMAEAQPSFSYIDANVFIEMHVVAIGSYDELDPDSSSYLKQVQNSYYQSVLDDMVKESKDILERIETADKISRKTISSFARLASKLINMGFLNKHLFTIGKAIENVVVKLPAKKKRLELSDLAQVQVLLDLCIDRNSPVHKKDAEIPAIMKLIEQGPAEPGEEEEVNSSNASDASQNPLFDTIDEAPAVQASVEEAAYVQSVSETITPASYTPPEVEEGDTLDDVAPLAVEQSSSEYSTGLGW